MSTTKPLTFVLGLSVFILALPCLGIVRADEPKDPTKKEQPKKNNEFEDLLKRLPGGVDDETAKIIREHMEMRQRLLEQIQRIQIPGGGILPIQPIQPIPDIFQLAPRAGRIPGGAQTMTEPRLGIRLESPSPTLVDQLDLPKDQGLVVQEITTGSPAAKAGLKQHDILLELGGKPMPSDMREAIKVVNDIKPDAAVEAVVLRKTKKETIKNLTLPKMAEQPKIGRQPNPRGGLLINPFAVPFGGAANSTTFRRINDGFQVVQKSGDLVLKVTGKVEDGKAVVTETTITEDGKTQTYTDVEKVPEAHRDRVKDLAQKAAVRVKK